MHAAALSLFAVYGWLNHWSFLFDLILAVMAIVAIAADLRLLRHPGDPRVPFQIHFLLSALFLIGTGLAVFAR